MFKKGIESPTIRPSIAYDADMTGTHGGTLRGVDILAPGTLFFVDIDGNADSYDLSGLTAGVPFRLILQIRKIVGDGAGGMGGGGTDIPLASIKGLK